MKKLPLKQLKENLSEWVEKVHKGESIEITKYAQPYVRLIPVQEPGLLVGTLVGKNALEIGIRKNTKGLFLKILAEDREGR